MKMRWVPILTIALTTVGCADFADEDGNTSVRQVAAGLQSLGDRMGELGEALERDADVVAVPWAELQEVIPEELDGSIVRDRMDGDDATDPNGAGLSMAAGTFAVRGDSMFVGVADLGALRGGSQVVLRWVAPLFARGEFEGDIDEIRIDGRPGVRIQDDEHDGVFVALMVEDRFVVAAGAHGPGHEAMVFEALDAVDYRQLGRWTNYGSN